MEEEFGQVLFPTYSPDLNPMENMWAALKQSVARDAPCTEERLVQSLLRNWKILTTPQNLKPYFENLFLRYLECVRFEQRPRGTEKNGEINKSTFSPFSGLKWGNSPFYSPFFFSNWGNSPLFPHLG